MSYKHHKVLYGVFAVGILAVIAISVMSSRKDLAIAGPSLRSAMAPAGVAFSGEAQQVDTGEALLPVVVHLKDIPPNVYSPNNQYDRWLRGEIDLGENEYRVSEQEALDLQTDALSLPPNANIQQAQSGPGLKAPVLGVSFDSLDRSECCGGGSVVPPDPIMAAGPNHLIAIVNLAFEIYDKTGTTLAGPTTMASFFASIGTGCASNPFDPNVVYDEETGRWIIAADGNGTHYCIAVSQTGDPLGAYNLYAVPAQPVGGEFHDYPHTGVGDSYIVVGANQFGGSIPGGFEGRVWALDKTVMYSGGALTPVTFSTGGTEGTPQPLHLHGFNQGTWPNLGSTHYFATDPYDGCTVNIWQWNIPSPPSIVSTYDLCVATGVTGGFPVNFPQSGGNTIQANDWRMREFEYRNGYGWIADSISCNPGGGTVDCVRWHQVNLTGTPALVQAGVYSSTGQYRTFPDLAVNHCDDMAIGYTKSSTSMFPSIWYTGRESSDPPGTLQAEAELKAGEITYTAFDTPPHRWGDYTGMAIDPDGVTFWYLGEYSKNISGNARWGTYIGSFTYPDCTLGGGNPEITLSKTVGTDPGVCATTEAITVTIGTDVTYCYEVENTGDVTLNLHTLEDTALGTLLSGFPFALSPGASAFLTQTTTIMATTVNTATWAAYNAVYYDDDTAPYSFIDISGTGTPLNLTDDGEANVTMPFQFTFYGVTSNLVRIGNNGGILFNTTSGDLAFTNTALPNGAHPLTIFPYWDDLDEETGNVYYETQGTAPSRMFIVQWHDRPHFPGPGTGSVTFQAILFEGSNEILFQYADLDFGDPAINYGASATVGLNENGSNALEYSFNSAVLTDNMAILFTPELALASDTATVTVLIPEITVDPVELAVTQAITSVMTYTLTISNIGDGDLQWTVDEELPVVNVPSGSDPHRQGTTTPRTTPVDINSFLGPIVTDGGFEAGTPSPFWNEASTNFGTPLCDASCGFGGGSGPHTGSWWAWFGGIAVYEEGSVDQNVTIPSGTATLSFWLEVPVACTNPTDYLEVLIDGTQVFLVNGTSSLCGVVGYSLQTVDITAFADGGVHNLEFHSEIFGGGVTNFFVDDVSIDISGPPPVCSTLTDIPWASVSPANGTTAAGESTDVWVTFDTTFLTVGNTYTATLCVNSNDPVTPLVTVPVTLTVVAQSFGVDLSGNQAASADAGTTVVYTLTITNTGNVVDTFDLSATGIWTATPSQASITLAPGASATFTVEVAIPGDALDGDTDVTTVTATSQSNASATDSATLTTTAIVIEPKPTGPFIYLPIVVR